MRVSFTSSRHYYAYGNTEKLFQIFATPILKVSTAQLQYKQHSK